MALTEKKESCSSDIEDNSKSVELTRFNGGEKNDEEIMKPLVPSDENDVLYHKILFDSQGTSDESITIHSEGNVGSSGAHGDFGAIGTASPKQVAVNIFISFVGAGMLGMPYAFARSGWLLGVVTLFITSAANLYALLLLLETRKKLESKGHENIMGYGDLGRIISGSQGEKFVNVCLVISQVGFATAYIIFIAANIGNITENRINRAQVCFGCVPILAMLVQIKDMKKLAPFSLLADVANILGFSAVLMQDFESYEYHHEPVIAINLAQVMYVASITLYSMEGVALVLPLESSCADRDAFPSLFKKCIFGITMLMAIFGFSGYIAFGQSTQAPITLNLPGGVWAAFVKLALCLALYLTYPIMMFPVHQVMEDMVMKGAGGRLSNIFFRAFVVLFSAFIAYSIPDFGKFLSLVGASICTILGFILPSYYHLKVFERSELTILEYFMDLFLILFGVIFGVFGTYQSFRDLLSNEQM